MEYCIVCEAKRILFEVQTSAGNNAVRKSFQKVVQVVTWYSLAA